MKKVIKFSKDEWNSFKSITSDKYPYVKFFKNKAIVTDKKIVVIKKFNHIICEKPFYIHRKDMTTMVGKDSYVRIMIKDNKVYLRNLKHPPILLKDAFKKVKFEKLNELKKLEESDNNSVSFTLKKDTLLKLLGCTQGNVINFRVHSDIFVSRWESDSMYGFVSQVKSGE